MCERKLFQLGCNWWFGREGDKEMKPRWACSSQVPGCQLAQPCGCCRKEAPHGASVWDMAQAKGSLGPRAQAGEDWSLRRDYGRARTVLCLPGSCSSPTDAQSSSCAFPQPGRGRAGSHSRMEHNGEEGALGDVAPGDSSKLGLCFLGSQRAYPW